jgi:triosephosphate isomerase
MRKPMMAGNWKMNKTHSEAQQLARDISAAVQLYDNVDRVICPPFVALPGVAWALGGGPLLLGAQNVH